MKKLRYNNLNNKTRLNHQFKFSSVALIISTSLMGYSVTSTPSVEAKDKADLNIETHSNSENTLEKRIQEGKKKIDKLKNIKDSQKDASIKEIIKAKSTEEVEAILKKAKKVDNKIIEQNKVQSHLIKNDKKEVSEDKESVKSDDDNIKVHNNKNQSSASHQHVQRMLATNFMRQRRRLLQLSQWQQTLKKWLP